MLSGYNPEEKTETKPVKSESLHDPLNQQQCKDITDLKIRGRQREENVAEKVNSRSFNLHSDYSKSLTLSNVGEPS